LVHVGEEDGWLAACLARLRGLLVLGLALEADGKPLPLGGRGPLWLLGPKDSFTGQEDEEGFAYAIIRIDVQ
jgi:hypothetical protein